MSKSTSGDNSYPNFDEAIPLGQPVGSRDSIPTGEPIEAKLGDMGISSNLVN